VTTYRAQPSASSRGQHVEQLAAVTGPAAGRQRLVPDIEPDRDPGKQWAPVVRMAVKGSTSAPRRRRLRATYRRTKGVRHLLAALDMNADKLYGHI
jgi:hypothetical protein